jgi:hypothetical protein
LQELEKDSPPFKKSGKIEAEPEEHTDLLLTAHSRALIGIHATAMTSIWLSNIPAYNLAAKSYGS